MSDPYPIDLYPGCPCCACDPRDVMNLCPRCGDKRCPGALHHDDHEDTCRDRPSAQEGKP